jgi:hypothetical protein
MNNDVSHLIEKIKKVEKKLEDIEKLVVKLTESLSDNNNYLRNTVEGKKTGPDPYIYPPLRF